MVATIGYLAGVFPPGLRDGRLRRARQRHVRRRPPQGGRRHPGGSARRTGRAHAGDERLPGASTGGESDARAPHPSPHGGRVPRRRRRATTSSACRPTAGTRVGPDGALGPEDGVDRARRWATSSGPQSLEATIRRAWEVTTASVPVLVTENGIGTDDDDQRIEYVRTRCSRACSAASTTASTCAATRTGACSTTSSGPSATGPVRAHRSRPDDPGARRSSRARGGSERSPARTRWTSSPLP